MSPTRTALTSVFVGLLTAGSVICSSLSRASALGVGVPCASAGGGVNQLGAHSPTSSPTAKIAKPRAHGQQANGTCMRIPQSKSRPQSPGIMGGHSGAFKTLVEAKPQVRLCEPWEYDAVYPQGSPSLTLGLGPFMW